jgi:hypothetical protein
MRLLSTQTREMRFLSTRTNLNEVDKHKIKGKLCCKAQEQRQMSLLSTRTNVNDGVKHKNRGKRG